VLESPLLVGGYEREEAFDQQRWGGGGKSGHLGLLPMARSDTASVALASPGIAFCFLLPMARSDAASLSGEE
jgi:hypothetical protein